MPPRGVKKGTKRARQYEHVKDSQRERGVSEGRAEEIAARTVNKERARSGESRTRSRTSTRDISSGRRGGLRSGRQGPRGRTREQLYQDARSPGVLEASLLAAYDDRAAEASQRMGVGAQQRQAHAARDPVDEGRREQERAAEEPDRAFVAEAELEEEAVGGAGREDDRDSGEDRR